MRSLFGSQVEASAKCGLTAVFLIEEAHFVNPPINWYTSQGFGMPNLF